MVALEMQIGHFRITAVVMSSIQNNQYSSLYRMKSKQTDWIRSSTNSRIRPSPVSEHIMSCEKWLKRSVNTQEKVTGFRVSVQTNGTPRSTAKAQRVRFATLYLLGIVWINVIRMNKLTKTGCAMFI